MAASKGIENLLQYQSVTYQKTVTEIVSKKQDDAKKDKTALPEFEDAADFLSGLSTKTDNKVDTDAIKLLKAINQKNYETLRDMVNKLMSGQSYYAAGRIDLSYESLSYFSDGKGYEELKSFKLDFSFSFEIYGENSNAEEVRKQAEELLSENGALGIKQVSENVMKFAKAISGGASSKIEFLRAATIKGYNEVAALFGGLDNMPDISKKTLEAIMKGFDDWAASAAAVAAE